MRSHSLCTLAIYSFAAAPILSAATVTATDTIHSVTLIGQSEGQVALHVSHDEDVDVNIYEAACTIAGASLVIAGSIVSESGTPIKTDIPLYARNDVFAGFEELTFDNKPGQPVPRAHLAPGNYIVSFGGGGHFTRQLRAGLDVSPHGASNVFRGTSFGPVECPDNTGARGGHSGCYPLGFCDTSESGAIAYMQQRSLKGLHAPSSSITSSKKRP